MTEFTPARLAELRAVAEAANGSSDDQSIGYDYFGDLTVGKGLVLALIAALEAKTAEVVTEEQITEEVAGHPIGSGYYQTTVSVDEAREMAKAVQRLYRR